MRDILRNPSIQYPKENYPDRAERAKLYNLRNWTLQHFLLDDTVKPLYKNTGYKNILTNKNISPGPEVFPPAPKNNLRIRIFLLNFGPKFFLHAKYSYKNGAYTTTFRVVTP